MGRVTHLSITISYFPGTPWTHNVHPSEGLKLISAFRGSKAPWVLQLEEQERITADLSETTQARQQWREEKSVNIP